MRKNKPAIVIGSDHGGYQLKTHIISNIQARYAIIDAGVHDETSVDYPDIAAAALGLMKKRRAVFGILICGTGIGISIAANRNRGIRAALCHDEFTARMARRHNDANVLCLGGRVLGDALALAIVTAFLAEKFEAGRHQRRVNKLR